MVSFLPLTKYRILRRFLRYARLIGSQLAESPGLIGFSFRASFLGRKFWTLSAWESSQALRAFVDQPPHRDAMSDFRPYMGTTRFVTWRVPGSALPPSWEDGLNRLAGVES